MSDEMNYIKQRLDPQIEWYSKRATENKTKYHVYQVVLIIVGVLIPVVNVIDYAPVETRVISAILGGIVVGITGMLQLKKHHENWIMYRSTEEALKEEKYTYLHSAGAYSELNDAERRKMLVEKSESIISNQNVIFFVTHKAKPHSE